MPKIAIVMGSDTDFHVVKETITILEKFDVAVDVRVISAHRTPELAFEYAKNAEAEGIELIIGAAGKAAHLPGVLAGISPLPVIGLPIKSSTMDGLDSLLSIVQMPVGVPVATVALDGALNAGILAAQILGAYDDNITSNLEKYKIELREKVEASVQDLKKNNV